MTTEIDIRKLETFVFRCPIDRPIRSAVGSYDNRPAVFVKIEDKSGEVGWGEAFCNFPTCGAEHRANLIETLFKPLLTGNKVFLSPEEAYSYLQTETAIIALKSGEFGPFAQCIAAIDIAIWDLWAKKKKSPVWKLLNAKGNPELKVYASGLGPINPAEMALAKRDEGYRAFKLKVGFEEKKDIVNLESLRNCLDEDALIMADANQVWSLEEASAMVHLFEKYNLLWIEEPLRCDRPLQDWQRLAGLSPVDLAAGECLYSEEQFAPFIKHRVIKFVQPDLIKWGGFSKIVPLLELFSEYNIQYCPHSLAGGIGLLASAHLLAASKSPGWLEVDANVNPMRDEIFRSFPRVKDGLICIGDEPGLGAEPDFDKIMEHRIR